MEEKIVFKAKKERERRAGSHFLYLGIRSIRKGEYEIIAAARGKIKKETRNNDFSTASFRAVLSC